MAHFLRHFYERVKIFNILETNASAERVRNAVIRTRVSQIWRAKKALEGVPPTLLPASALPHSHPSIHLSSHRTVF